jgi:hypothetical protein
MKPELKPQTTNRILQTTNSNPQEKQTRIKEVMFIMGFQQVMMMITIMFMMMLLLLVVMNVTRFEQRWFWVGWAAVAVCKPQTPNTNLPTPTFNQEFLNPKPKTLNPKLKTPKPQTLNPKQVCSGLLVCTVMIVGGKMVFWSQV